MLLGCVPSDYTCVAGIPGGRMSHMDKNLRQLQNKAGVAITSSSEEEAGNSSNKGSKDGNKIVVTGSDLLRSKPHVHQKEILLMPSSHHYRSIVLTMILHRRYLMTRTLHAWRLVQVSGK